MTIGPLGKFAYVTTFYSDDVSAYAIDAKGGALTQVQGSPFGTGVNPAEVAVNPSGTFAFIANGYGENVSAYSIKSTGVLTQLKKSPFAAGAGPVQLAIR